MTDSITIAAKRLHPLSWVFYFASLTPKVLFPLLGFLILGQNQNQWTLWAMLIITPIYLWAGLRAWLYRYQISDDELLIRDGVIDRTLRHIPLARIQNISQRRKFLHRILGVTELRLESASGNKPEAVMKVVSFAAASELEALLHRHHGSAVPGAGLATDSTIDCAPDLSPTRVLHQLPMTEIVRLGIISNRGTMLAAFLFATIVQKDALRKFFAQKLYVLTSGIQSLVDAQLATHHQFRLVVGMVIVLVIATILLRLLSVVLAVLRYKGFTLELEGERLLAQHGMGTQVRTSARLPRLQRWLLEETWLHRRFQRYRLAVTVVGSNHHDQHDKLGADGNFTELAPIATHEQAQALLRLCLPTLDWDQLQWQSLPMAAKRRLLGQARWVVPAIPGLLWLDQAFAWRLPWPLLVLALALLTAALIAHALAWQRFAAYAESGEILLWRSGVFHKRWVIIATSRLQALRISSSPLDRRLGLQTLQADTQGGCRRKRALHIPCLGEPAALALRERIWQRLHTSARF